jgi:hypothetical protein
VVSQHRKTSAGNRDRKQDNSRRWKHAVITMGLANGFQGRGINHIRPILHIILVAKMNT